MSKGQPPKGKQASIAAAAQPQPGPGVATGLRAVQLEFSGPLPPAAELQKYEAVAPGVADRIIRMAEAEQAHRHRMDQKIFTHEARRSWGGLAMGGVIALSFFAGSVYLVATGEAVAGTILGTVDLVALVTVFVLGRRAPAGPTAEDD